MQDTLEVRVKDISTLLESDLSTAERRELDECIKEYLHEDWANDEVVEFNEDPDGYDEVILRDLLNIFFEREMPYVYFSDGDDSQGYDAYYEYYNKDVSKTPTKAYQLYEQNGYAIAQDFLLKHQDEDAETFKQSIIKAISDPFKDYPSLDSVE